VPERWWAELDEEFDRLREIVDHDADVFHPLDCLGPDGLISDG
jgi:hypothetical protein